MRAVILAAGMGSRLAELTAETPKPLVSVGGRPMLHRALECLSKHGITEAVLVVGHLRDAIRRSVGEIFSGVEIRYVVNEHYDTTSNLHSLWLAREFLDTDTLLLESDLVYDDAVIERMCTGPPDAVALDVYMPFMDGTAAVVEDGMVVDMILKAEQGDDFTIEGKFKTVNIYRWSEPFLKGSFVEALNEANRHDDKSLYYEKVLGDLIRRGERMAAVSVAGAQWYEIDNMDDLEAAHAIFGCPGG